MNLPRPRIVSRVDFDNVRALDLGVLPMLEKMERVGIRVNLGKVKKLDNTLADMQADVEAKIERAVGRAVYYSERWKKGVFNPKSGDQIAEMLFDVLKINSDGLKLTKSGTRPKTDKKALETLRERHPIAPLLIEHSELAKLRDAFTRPMPRWVGPDGRIRCRIQYTRVPTGRLAPKEPNLAQIPARTKMGKMIRGCFEPDDGCLFISVDQSQIEMRVVAHCSDDPVMRQIFLDNEDLHWMTAQAIYGLPIPKDPDDPQPGELTKEMRARCKNVGFGILYGITHHGLRDQIIERITDAAERASWTKERVIALIDDWFKVYEGVRAYMRAIVRQVETFGYVNDMWGRLTYMPGIRSTHYRVTSATIREAMNNPVQGGAAGTMKLACRDMWPDLEEFDVYESLTCRALMLIHDEVLVEATEEIAEQTSCMIQERVENAVELSVPVLSGASIGTDWSQLK